jgi:hypothetical protein
MLSPASLGQMLGMVTRQSAEVEVSPAGVHLYLDKFTDYPPELHEFR